MRRALGLLIAAAALSIGFFQAPDQPLSWLIQPWGLPPSQFDEISGVLTHDRIQGRASAPTVLFLADWGSSLHEWDGVARTLRDRLHVVTVDLPGSGLSDPAPSGTYTVDAQARWLADYIRARHLGPVWLVAHGLTADTAWQLAQRDPQLVRGLMLETPWPRDAQGVLLNKPWLPWVNVPVLDTLAGWVLPPIVVQHAVAKRFGEQAVPGALVDTIATRTQALMVREGHRNALSHQWRQQQVFVPHGPPPALGPRCVVYREAGTPPDQLARLSTCRFEPTPTGVWDWHQMDPQAFVLALQRWMGPLR